MQNLHAMNNFFLAHHIFMYRMTADYTGSAPLLIHIYWFTGQSLDGTVYIINSAFAMKLVFIKAYHFYVIFVDSFTFFAFFLSNEYFKEAKAHFSGDFVLAWPLLIWKNHLPSSQTKGARKQCSVCQYVHSHYIVWACSSPVSTFDIYRIFFPIPWKKM